MQYNNLFSPSKLKDIFNQYNIKPRKSLGQNFLIDRNIVNKIIDAARLSKKDTVVEVGAGLGVLTVPMAQTARQVIAYEIDERLAPILREAVAEYENVEIVNEDVLENVKCQNPNVKSMSKSKCQINNISNTRSYKVVGNLPYYITSRILRHFLSAEHKPQSIIITIQKEVAERICAKPPQMSLLSASVQVFGRPQIIAQVSKNCFWPMPQVDSAIVRIDLKTIQELLMTEEERQFFIIVKAGFSSKRKMLLNNLRQKLGGEKIQWEEIFSQAGLKPTIRAQEMGVEEWKRLLNGKFQMSNQIQNPNVK